MSPKTFKTPNFPFLLVFFILHFAAAARTMPDPARHLPLSVAAAPAPVAAAPLSHEDNATFHGGNPIENDSKTDVVIIYPDPSTGAYGGAQPGVIINAPPSRKNNGASSTTTLGLLLGFGGSVVSVLIYLCLPEDVKRNIRSNCFCSANIFCCNSRT